jgi:two-component system NarL family sensor kinase
MENAAALLAVSVRQLRETASDLWPTALVGVDLGEGVQLLVKQISERGSIECDVRVDSGARVVDDRAVLAIIRELLSNVARHARARSASVEVAPFGSDRVRVTVTDDGIGLSRARMREAIAEGHIGLSLTAARVEDLGGSLEIRGNPDRGTTLVVDLPALES